MGFCEQCGTKLIEGERFCGGCGKPAAPAQNEASVAAKMPARQCANCGKALEPDWVLCPYCKTETGPKSCAGCARELAQDWLACPYCKTEV